MLYESSYYGLQNIDADYLEHHGIKGQKWGIRRYQNPDGSLTEAGKIRLKGANRKTSLIKEQLGIDVKPEQFLKADPHASEAVTKRKGERVYHVTPLDFKELRDGQDLFVSATDRDRDMYKSFLSMMMRRKGYDSIKEVSFALKEDLRSPSNKDQKKLFQECYEKNKGVFDKDLDSYYSSGATRPSDTYDAFIKALDKNGLTSKSVFYDHMKNAGYNAILDQHDVTGSWMQASRPLILMDVVNTVGDIRVTSISDDDIKKSLKKLSYI